MLKLLSRTLIFLLISHSVMAQAIPGRSCKKVHQADFPAETSIEMELELSPRLAQVLTSPDGLIQSLFKSPEQIPDHVKELASKESFDLETTPLDSLRPETRAEIFRAAIVANKLVFKDSAQEGRVIPHLVVKTEFRERYNLRAKIDLGSPETVKDGRLIEIHMRSKKESGDLLLDSADFFKFLGLKPQPVHMHVVMKLPQNWLTEQNGNLQEMRSFQITEHWRRMNLFFEMRDVVEKGVGVINNSGGGYMNFAPLQFDQMSSAYSYLRNLNPNRPEKLGSEAKMGWIGLWGSDKYDGKGLMGFEFRFLTGLDHNPEMQNFLNQFPDQFTRENFSNTPEQLQDWYSMVQARYAQQSLNLTFWQQLRFIFQQSRPVTELPDWLYKSLSPHQTPKDLISASSPEIRYVLLGLNQQKLFEDLQQRRRLRYLLHDWSKDPSLFDKAELIEKIRQTQIRGVRKWARGENETAVVQEFLIDSGLLFHFGQSVGYQL